MSPGSPPAGLVADAMLGRLARWLRALGRDVVFDEALHDNQLADIARRQGRLLLTRDRGLCPRREGADWCRLVAAQRPRTQLLELDEPLGLFAHGWRRPLFTRCMVCNTPLRDVPHEAVRDALPPDVRSDPRVRSAGFRRCPACHRVYWEGSHTRRMRRWLNQVAAEARQR